MKVRTYALAKSVSFARAVFPAKVLSTLVPKIFSAVIFGELPCSTGFLLSVKIANVSLGNNKVLPFGSSLIAIADIELIGRDVTAVWS